MATARKKQDLNEKQKAFVQAYALCHNATQAALQAGYSKKSAHSTGHALLKHREVKRAIDSINVAKESAAILSRDEALEILTEIARAKCGDYIGDTDASIQQINPHAIASYEVKEDRMGDRTVKFRLWDKERAIERIAKMQGWDAPDQIEVAGDMVYRIQLPEELQPKPE